MMTLDSAEARCTIDKNGWIQRNVVGDARFDGHDEETIRSMMGSFYLDVFVTSKCIHLYILYIVFH